MSKYTRRKKEVEVPLKVKDPPANFFTEVVDKAGRSTTSDYVKEALGSSTIIAVGLRIEDQIRHCLPVEIKIKNGKIVEAAPVYPEAEEISYALARATGALQEKAERASSEQWPPDYERYELVGSALQSLSKPIKVRVGPELPVAPPAPEGLLEAVTDELMRRWPLWVRSVASILQTARVRHVEYRETLTAHKWSALNGDGGAVSTLSIEKGVESA